MAGRGIDFEHRFNTSRWAEDLLKKSLNEQSGLIAVRFGLSEVKPSGKIKYDKAAWKEPDLLVFETAKLTKEELASLKSGDFSEMEREKLQKGGPRSFLTEKACAAIEVEFSPYKASEMKHRNWALKTKEQWTRRPLKHANPPTAPNIWVKEEDLSRLNGWVSEFRVPIVIAHLFDQEGFAVKLSAINALDKNFGTDPVEQRRLQLTTGIFKKVQSYDRQDAQGAGEKKPVFVITPAAAVKIGEIKDVQVSAQLGISASKKYVTHAIFSDGSITFCDLFLSMLIGMRT